MKNNLKKAVTALSVTFISVGLILCVISANNGGSFLRAMQNNGVDLRINAKGNNNEYYDPYNNNSSDRYYRGGNSADDEMRDFFRQFGMSDDEIEMFIDPFGNSSGGNSKGNYPIQ